MFQGVAKNRWAIRTVLKGATGAPCPEVECHRCGKIFKRNQF